MRRAVTALTLPLLIGFYLSAYGAEPPPGSPAAALARRRWRR
jgi:hypothetical protein